VRARRTTLLGVLVLALVCALSPARPAAAQSSPAAPDLRSPALRSTRYSAYTLPKGVWSVELGALGMGDELYGLLGGAYGLGKGFQLNLNLVHYATGLFNVTARWNFLDLPHFGLGLSVGFDYGHGDWVWVVNSEEQELLDNADLIAFPMSLTASAPLNRWVQLDLAASYQHAELFGTLGEGATFYADAQIGARIFQFRPGARVFLSDDTAFEFFASLPAYARVPYEGDITSNRFERAGAGEAKVKFSSTWAVEVGLRSAIRPWLFCNIRLDFGPRADVLYGAQVYPSFSIEARL
jgi:hypothetical protein